MTTQIAIIIAPALTTIITPALISIIIITTQTTIILAVIVHVTQLLQIFKLLVIKKLQY